MGIFFNGLGGLGFGFTKETESMKAQRETLKEFTNRQQYIDYYFKGNKDCIEGEFEVVESEFNGERTELTLQVID